MLRTSFTDLVGCVVPIQMAGMGPGTPELAGAVARAGGLGVISAGWLGRPNRAVSRIEMAGPAAPGQLAVNLLVPVADNIALLDIVAPHVRLIDFFWADPDPGLVARAHDAGALVSWQVGSAVEAKAAQDVGVDIVVAQGNEAGGHVRGTLPLFEVLDEVLAAVEVPVLASGGIASGRMLAAVLAAGAAGARVGTRLVATEESGAHPDYVKALAAASHDDSVATALFSAGCPLCPSTHRVLRSSIEAAQAFDGEVVGTLTGPGPNAMEMGPFHFAPPGLRTTGEIAAMAMYAGRGVGHCRHGQAAHEVITELATEAETLLRAAGSAVRPA